MTASGVAQARTERKPVLAVEDLVVEFPAGRNQTVHAVSGISFDLVAGETLGIVGESGCGKSTAGRAVLQLPKPKSGSVRLDGTELTALSASELRKVRAQMQMIMQDPISSLNPRRKVKHLVTEGPRIWGSRDRAKLEERARNLLTAVGLDPEMVWDRLPGELSGGQCQRVCIARAMMLEPKLLICDEPVSSLDVSVQAQILNLLEATKKRFEFTMIFIAHNMAVVKNISDRVMVMYLGKVCEVSPSSDMENIALHPYSKLLLASIPDPDRHRDDVETIEQIEGDLPSPLNPPSGCRFRTRCPLATERCAAEEPQLRNVGENHYVACHNV
ncbi:MULTISPECIES: ABC transporter ATP-binding protein [unclassified Rhodococcus (in: high G+C Gram-positive bacteria)]|uniref:ABC transporter ATP-binding protein n=1 Tax=unclassified Rhodococcus (in: high G+C Gram-positive bacteria) TaxID=192944 RepID=UPI000E0BC736|nr:MULTISPECIES: oligopeptide/dipeptide ABC transporter ATP-binding protein [unclassified Rhodococcus (in: high G+C Gram-positive bacteria)]QKT13474.1 ATP-binding cassette domain-containing protein [Rhodococcus sp. W8901]RDI24898.1 peptide/nickel transport system ATP-binding protein [Rhodococcus sp. AG1013]